MSRRSKRALSLALLLCSHWCLGQNATAKPGRTPPSVAFDSLLSRFEADMMDVVVSMPADQFQFKPSSSLVKGSKYEGVRSFAEEVKHVAWSNFATVSSMTGNNPGMSREAIDGLQDRADIIASLQASFGAAHDAIHSLTPANENDLVEDVGVGGVQSRVSLAAWIVAHGYDHYGQLVEYLRMNGIAPPSRTPAVQTAK